MIDWKGIEEVIGNILDETIENLDPDETLQRIIMSDLKNRLLFEVSAEIDLLHTEYMEEIEDLHDEIGSLEMDNLLSEKSVDS